MIFKKTRACVTFHNSPVGVFNSYIFFTKRNQYRLRNLKLGNHLKRRLFLILEETIYYRT